MFQLILLKCNNKNINIYPNACKITFITQLLLFALWNPTFLLGPRFKPFLGLALGALRLYIKEIFNFNTFVNLIFIS